MATYLDELDVKATDYAVRVQIACAQAIIEAIREQPRFTHWSGTATKPEDYTSDAAAAWEAHKRAYEIVRAEMDDLHRTLTVAGVPEQIPPFKVALAPAKARVLFLSTRCDQLFNEAANLRERLDQFEAYAITVKSALDDRDRVRELQEELRTTLIASHVHADEHRQQRDRAARYEALLREWSDDACGCDTATCRGTCLAARTRAALAGGGCTGVHTVDGYTVTCSEVCVEAEFCANCRAALAGGQP
jgi:hypothetical protein